jgi:hypothetical protein
MPKNWRKPGLKQPEQPSIVLGEKEKQDGKEKL